MNTQFSNNNAYMTLDDGTIYRAVAIAGKWRLAIKIDDKRFDFVNDIQYNSAAEALSAIGENKTHIKW